MEAGARTAAAHALPAPAGAAGGDAARRDRRRLLGRAHGPGIAPPRTARRVARLLGARRHPGRAARPARAAGGVPVPRACANVAVPRRGRRGAGSLDDRGGPLLPMKNRLPLVELLLCALCLWAGWYHTPAGALVRSVGAWLFGTRSTARPLLAYFGAGKIVPPRIPPMLPGPVPPAQALAYGAAAVLDASPLEVGPRLRATAQRLGSDDAALLAMFCGEEAARYALDE